MSKETFARETRMTVNEAEDFVDNFYRTFPTMAQYLDDVKRCVIELGMVQSIYGRPLAFDSTRSTANEASKARVSAMIISFKCD